MAGPSWNYVLKFIITGEDNNFRPLSKFLLIQYTGSSRRCRSGKVLPARSTDRSALPCKSRSYSPYRILSTFLNPRLTQRPSTKQIHKTARRRVWLKANNYSGRRQQSCETTVCVPDLTHSFLRGSCVCPIIFHPWRASCLSTPAPGRA